MKFEDKYNLLLNEVNEGLKKAIISKDNYQKDIYRAMNYSLLGGGKRIRPIILLAAGQVLALEKDKLMPFALALEMIHTYSLIHDDLPALDDDRYRRGRETCHIVFGEDIAILAGDGLLTRAFELMSIGSMALDDPLKGLKIISQVANLIGTEGMIGGQVIDIQSQGKEATEDMVIKTYMGKTGALLKACILVAIEAKGHRDSKGASALLEYIEAIGLAFQLKDDILDQIGDPDLLGKMVGRDKEKEKINFLSIYDLDYSKKYLEELSNKAVESALSLGDKGVFLKDLALYLLKRER